MSENGRPQKKRERAMGINERKVSITSRKKVLYLSSIYEVKCFPEKYFLTR